MESKKTGATPIPDGDLGRGEIRKIVKGDLMLVDLRDGRGAEVTELAVRFPNGALYFLQGVKYVPAQTWVKKAIEERLKEPARG